MTAKEDKQNTGFDMSKIKAKIEQKLKSGVIEDHEAQILEQRAPAMQVVETLRENKDKIA